MATALTGGLEGTNTPKAESRRVGLGSILLLNYEHLTMRL
jgi:hypothetical protein